jgi:lipoate-protein ligase B
VNLPAVPATLAAEDTYAAYFLGSVEYRRACNIQEQLLKARHLGEIAGDIILILQHPPVLTVGKAGHKPEHILVSEEKLKHEGIPVCCSSRGGGITYHGPGQLVCYPIFNLRRLGLTVKQYIYNLEEVVIDVLAQFDIKACRMPQAPGVWVNDAEISSIGIYVTHGITMHGFTLNVNTDLSRFSYIAVCGVPDKKITSMAHISGIEPPIEDFITPLIGSFDRVFNLDIQPGNSTFFDEYIYAHYK